MNDIEISTRVNNKLIIFQVQLHVIQIQTRITALEDLHW